MTGKIRDFEQSFVWCFYVFLGRVYAESAYINPAVKISTFPLTFYDFSEEVKIMLRNIQFETWRKSDLKTIGATSTISHILLISNLI